MDIVSIGGGPAGLYFAILMKKAFPACRIRVLERNRADDTFGWGVVFSDETLSNFEEADPESYARITREFASWGEIDTFYRGTRERSTGHGFCGLSRKRLLEIFHERCRELGVELAFQKEVSDLEPYLGADLVLAADGVNSAIRDRWKEHFQPTIEWGKCRFSWLGTTKPLSAFTFLFRENEHGLFVVHAYPFQKELSTFILECHETTWHASGLDEASEAETVAYAERLFADFLGEHRLLTNRSLWRSFPTVRNERWHHRNVVLIGDAAHTAHFSIGSGTKLAMEDAIALVDAFREHGTGDVPRVLAAYEEARRVPCLKIQKAAQTSLEWFEKCARYMHQPPAQLSFNLMTRSKQITWDKLAVRDPGLTERMAAWFAAEEGAPKASDGTTPPPLFAPLALRGLRLENRVCVSPMCQYSSVDGAPNDWHLAHLGARAVGGAGLLFTEMTNVSAEGRITHGCAGIYRDEHVPAWKRIVDFVHAHSRTKIGMQLGHAGRKGSCTLPWEGDKPIQGKGAWTTLGPSADPFDRDFPAPRAMTRADMERVLGEYVAAARRAAGAGFDLVELHMAHGYLLSSFLSPKSNSRRDEWGGALENRMRYPLAVFEAVRGAWPADLPVAVRISASDWLDDEGGFTIDEAVVLSRALHERGCDLVDVSSAGNTPESEPVYGRMYQVPFAERIKQDVPGLRVMAVGAILGADHVNTILAAGRADLCAIARGHLLDPHLTLRASVAYGFPDQFFPPQYLAAKPQPKE